MDLDTAANYAEIIGLLTILGAAVYSWYQIKEMKASRESQGALFVGDALAGNDAVEQAMEFQRMLKSDGAVLCKLDTDVKGGQHSRLLMQRADPLSSLESDKDMTISNNLNQIGC